MLRYTRISLLALALTISLVGSVRAGCPVGDLSGDCEVNLKDLQLFVEQWLDDPACLVHLDDCANLNYDSKVNLSDFALLAENWGAEGIPLVINEFMAKNDTFIQDPDDPNDYDDWIEIYNYGDSAIDIGGMYLTDDLNEPSSEWWQIPDNDPCATTIRPHGYLLIWADGETSEGTLHAGFSIKADEDIGLFDTDGNTPIDSFIGIPAQDADDSYGRFPDASDNWQVFSAPAQPPTPGQSNEGKPVDILISEIMYHPYHSTSGTIEPEDIREEYVELFNRGTALVGLSGWGFSDGVDFAFPNDVTIGAGQYLVVAADVATFTAKYPSVTNVIGGWDGRLSNSGEAIRLNDDMGITINRVRYADEGDWAVRELSPEDYYHRGWRWSDEHDGDGKSLELINPVLPNEYGQNWAASLNNGGTPGTTNSRAMSDIAPLILEVKHFPIIPGLSEPVTVTARIIDELTSGITVTLHHRLDGQPTFNMLTMLDEGTQGDGDANDGIYGAQIPAQPDGTIVELYIQARDAGANSRTWPAPSMVDGTPQQVTNLLYQVDETFDPDADWVPGSQPIYYIIMTEVERAELSDIGDSDLDGHSGFTSEAMSNAQMNATFISADGVDTKVRYNVGVRNRGNRNRYSPPMSYRVNFRHDRSWKDMTALNINSKYPHLHLMGSWLFQMAGITAANATVVQVRVNGQNLAASDYSRTYNSYIALENYDSDWVDNHVPDDDAGNLYRCTYFDNGIDPRTWADLDYKPNMTEYRKNYPKQTNAAQDDYSDLLNLIDKLNNSSISDEDFLTEVSQVLNLKQWTRFLAADALVGNREGGLTDGNGDDYAMYCGVEDPRFWLLPHDLDTLLGQGDHSYRPDWDIFNYAGVTGLNRLLNHPDVIKLYYSQYQDLINTVFAAENIYPLLDRLLGDWVPQSEIGSIKQFVIDRDNSILYGGYPGSGDAPQIPQEFTINNNLPVVSGYPRTTSAGIGLSGTANTIETQSVLVNGQLAEWSQRDGAWDGGAALPGELLFFLPMDTTWSYEQSNTDLGTAWRAPDYNDSSWPTGRALLYVENAGLPGPKNTPLTIGATTYYFRTHFWFDGDPNEVAELQVYTILDDGAVIYLNGHNGNDARRIGIDPGPLSHTDYADRTVGDATREGPFTIPAAHLVHGDNVIAVENHQSSSGSSDIVWGMELEALGPTTGGDIPLHPGINRVTVQTFDGPGGSGNELEREHTDIWYDTGSTNDYPKSSELSVDLLVRDSYLPGIPVLVRVEVVRGNGSVERELWDAAATLSVDNPSVNLSTNQVTLYNGLGSALVTFTGSGDFTLTANVNGLEASRSLTDLTAEPVTTVSGSLSNSDTWSGIYHITGGDFTIPDGVTLTLNPGTLVLIDGVSSGENGTDIDVAGSIQSLGTATSPVTFTAYTAGENWGELHHVNAEPSTFQYTNITRAGHSPRVGHSNSGPTIRASNSTFVFDHASLTDNAGKLGHITSGCDLTFRNCLFARSVMGPEISGTALLFEDSWMTDMHAGDDADGIYIGPQQGGQTCIMRRGVSANIVDDGIDLNGADITIEDFIVRDCNDKGISVYNGETNINHCLVVETNRDPEDPTVVGVAAKATEGATTIVNIDHTTIVTTRTLGVIDYGIQSHNKYGVTTGTIIWNVTNSIIDATDPVNVQAPYLESDVHISYSNVFGETWPGTGNINANPVFVDEANHNYHIQESSPCIDAGDPNDDLDPDQTATDQGYFWFNQGPPAPPGSLLADTVWTPEQGPYRVTDDLTVPVGITLTIMPGTTVFFEPATRLIIQGCLIAEGAEHQLIRFTRTPGATGTWDGLQFVDTMSDNRITYAVVEYGRTMDGMIGLDQSNLLLDHVTLDHTDRRRIRTFDSSLIVRNSTFTNLFELGQPPTGDNICEHIWGAAPTTGHFIIENNVFGTITGHNDAIDVDGNSRPGPVIQILGNLFLGGGDDALDLEGDAHIEGNVFLHYRKDEYNTGSGNANIISAGGGHEYVVVRNVFYDMDHVAQVKNDSFMTFVNNTVVDVAVSALYFLRPTSTTGYGRGAYVDGSIFWNTTLVFDRFTVSTDLTANRSIIPSEWHYLGQGNIDADPVFVDPNTDFHLKPVSPAIGTGPCGLDMGAYVPAGAAICGEPDEVTYHTEATLTVGGPGITHYKYCLNDPNGPWSEEPSVDVPIELTGLADENSYTVYVIGKNSAGVWQNEDDATASRTWTVDVSHWRLVINEVLAQNVETVDHEGTTPDLIELYYDGPAPLDLSSISISDDLGNPRKFVFPGGTTIDPCEHLVLYADDHTVTSGIHLGFALDGDGEGVYLYNSPAAGRELLDSVEFGMQLGDLSIGRVGYEGQWKLTQPTFGTANVAQPLGNPATLKINEWLANEEVLFKDDFIELFNPHPSPVDLGGMYLTDNPVTQPDKHKIPPLSFVPGAGYVIFIADGDEQDGPHHLNFKLSPDQQILGLFDTELNEIDKVIYGPQMADVSQGRAPDGADTYAFSEPPTPGVSNIDTVVINEVLAHSHGIAADWIELYNTTDANINIGGWFLSDNSANRMKYQIAEGTMIDANNYKVFYQDTDFNDPCDPGCHIPFALSENGEMVCLSSGLDGMLTGYYKKQDFGTSETGVSFGRYLKSTGTYDFVAMEYNTPDELNAPPKVGPIVINEIMYHPDWPAGGPYDKEEYEYIELYNTSGSPVTLYRSEKGEPWKFTDGIDFTFPSGPVVTIPASGYLLVVRNPAAFAWRYPAVPTEKVLGPYGGRLSNAGEEVEISMPGDVDTADERQYICIGRVHYYDKVPWPTTADGGGKSLTRKVPADYGNDVINWKPASPSPGVVNP